MQSIFLHLMKADLTDICFRHKISILMKVVEGDDKNDSGRRN